MAGGLGTRMKSATPKHLHPLLGRRMVDWVVAGRARRGRRPRRRRRVARHRRRVRRRRGRRAADAARHRRRRPLARATALAGVAGDVLVLNGDVPALTAELLARARRDASRAQARPATVLAFEPDDRALVRPHRPRRATAASRASSRRATRRPRSSRSARSTPAIYVFRAEQLWPALERLEPHNAQGELYVTDTLGLLVADGEAVAVHTRARCRARSRASTRASSSPSSPATLRDRINERAHARRRHDRRSGVDLDRGRRRDRARRDDPSVHRAARRDVRIATGAEIGRTSSPSTPDRRGARGPFVPSAGTVLERGQGRARSSR